MIDLLQPVALFCIIGWIYAVNYSGFLSDDDSQIRRQQINFYASLYLLHCHFTGGGNYLKGAVLRNLTFCLIDFSHIIYKNSKGDEVNFIAEVLVSICFLVPLEISVFNNYKTKLRLFLQVKQLKQ